MVRCLGKGFPTSMVINSKAEIVYMKVGGSSDKKLAKEIIMKEIYPAILKTL